MSEFVPKFSKPAGSVTLAAPILVSVSRAEKHRELLHWFKYYGALKHCLPFIEGILK